MRFAGYMMATAGGATGLWAATGAASNAVVTFATDLLENAMKQGSSSAIRELQSSLGGSQAQSHRAVRHRWRLNMHRAGGSTSGQHRHHSQVEALDLALPLNPAARPNGEPQLEVGAAVLTCALLCAAGTLLHGWMQILFRPEVSPRGRGGTSKPGEAVGRTPSTSASGHTPSTSASSEELVFPGAGMEGVSGGEEPPALPQGPRPGSPPQGMHCADLSRSRSGLIRQHHDSSSRTIRNSQETVRRIPIQDIRRYFMAAREDWFDSISSTQSAHVTSASVPAPTGPWLHGLSPDSVA